MKKLLMRNMVGLALSVVLGSMTFAQEAPVTNEAVPEAPAPLVIPDPVAMIAGKSFTKAEYEDFLAFLQEQGQPVPSTQEEAINVLQSLGIQSYLMDKAKASKLDESAEYKKHSVYLLNNFLAMSYMKDYIDAIEISDAEIQAAYKKEVEAVKGKEFNASHILVADEAKAKDITEKIKSKKISFEDAAKEFSEDGSGKEGGSLGWFTANMMDPVFSAKVQSLKKGEMTPEPLETKFGFHIIRVDDIRDVAPPALTSIKPQLENMLKGEKIQALIEEAKKAAQLEIFIK